MCAVALPARVQTPGALRPPRSSQPELLPLDEWAAVPDVEAAVVFGDRALLVGGDAQLQPQRAGAAGDGLVGAFRVLGRGSESVDKRICSGTSPRVRRACSPRITLACRLTGMVRQLCPCMWPARHAPASWESALAPMTAVVSLVVRMRSMAASVSAPPRP